MGENSRRSILLFFWHVHQLAPLSWSVTFLVHALRRAMDTFGRRLVFPSVYRLGSEHFSCHRSRSLVR
jgi:hypothetical protein